MVTCVFDREIDDSTVDGSDSEFVPLDKKYTLLLGAGPGSPSKFDWLISSFVCVLFCLLTEAIANSYHLIRSTRSSWGLARDHRVSLIR